MVPSKIDSPIWGMTTSVPGPPLLPPPPSVDSRTGGAVSVLGGCLGADVPSAWESGFTWGVAPSVEAAPPAGCAALCAGCLGWDAPVDAAAPSASMTPTTVLICTVAPSETLISFNTPLAGEGISASTLSVEISNSGSSRCTFSPGFFSHLVMVPSTIDSPIWGMITSVGMSPFPQRHLKL